MLKGEKYIKIHKLIKWDENSRDTVLKNKTIVN